MAEIITKQCPVCEESFETKYPDKIYCSPKCQAWAKHNRRKDSPTFKEMRSRAQKRYLDNHPEVRAKELHRLREWAKNKYVPVKRFCPKCGQEMKKKRWKNKLCDDCDKRRPYEKQKEYVRENHLKRNYGITQRDYDRMLESQNGVCKVCGRKPGKRRLSVDHDHDTGEVRGLLCVRCNVALGYVKDDVSVLQKLMDYLCAV